LVITSLALPLVKNLNLAWGRTSPNQGLIGYMLLTINRVSLTSIQKMWDPFLIIIVSYIWTPEAFLYEISKDIFAM
jgi:hypothetical protein